MFKRSNFCHVASNNRNNVKAGLFVYRTTDDVSTVTTSGYFNEMLIDINQHDIIIHEQVNASDPTEVTINTLVVTSKTLDNITTKAVETGGGASALSELTDVDLSTLSDGQVLTYDADTSKWVNETLADTGVQTTSNLVTSVSSASADTEYPSAKLFYDTCGDVESLINAL